MNEVITCVITGVASLALGDVQSNPSGREIWTGVRIRTADGKTRFFPSMLVEAEASLILNAARRRGDQVELWLSGKDQRPYPYGIKTAEEDWYGDDFSNQLRKNGIMLLVVGILTLPLLGLGFFGLMASLGFFLNASTFSARHPRAIFDLGYQAGVLGRRPVDLPGERLRAA